MLPDEKSDLLSAPLASSMIDQAALSRLIKALGALQDNGGYEQVWTDGTIDSLKNLDHGSESLKAVSEAQSTLRDLENIKTVLAGLSASLEETVADIKKHLRPFELGTGLASIPDEILAKILEHAEAGYGRNAAKKEVLSLVSRRFRRVVLDTAILWSHIDSHDRMPYVRTCLKRSKAAGLSIRLSIKDGASLDHGLSFLAELIPHSPRWERLRILFNISEVESDIRQKILQSAIFSNLLLPSLHSLVLLYEPRSYNNPVNDPIRHFYQNWEMPRLRSLDIDLPPKLFIAPSLSSFRFSSTCLEKGESEQLEKFITAFPDLEELDFSLRWSNEQTFHHKLVLRMPKLRALRFAAAGCKLGDIRSFMVALRAPLLRKLDLELPMLETQDDRETALLDMFPVRRRALEALSIKFAPPADRECEIPSNTFCLPFRKLCGLRSLCLDIQGLLPYIPYTDWGQADMDSELRPAPSLHTLVLTRCGSFEHEWLSSFQERLQDEEAWDGFKQLEVSCLLNERELNCLCGGVDKKVIFIEAKGES